MMDPWLLWEFRLADRQGYLSRSPRSHVRAIAAQVLVGREDSLLFDAKDQMFSASLISRPEMSQDDIKTVLRNFFTKEELNEDIEITEDTSVDDIDLSQLEMMSPQDGLSPEEVAQDMQFLQEMMNNQPSTVSVTPDQVGLQDVPNIPSNGQWEEVSDPEWN